MRDWSLTGGLDQKMSRANQTDKAVSLKHLASLGAFRVDLEGESHPAPFSRKSCIWSDWIYITAEFPSDDRFHYGERMGDSFLVKTEFGALDIDSRRIQLYLEASFQGRVDLDGEEVLVTEYCLEPEVRYFAMVETFDYSLPGFRLMPFLPRRKTALRLALSDRAFVGDRPVPPLVPTFRGMTWGA